MQIIEIKNLTKKFGTLTAVDSLDLTIEKGEVFGLLGPNGAGKSTTLLMLTTLIPPTSGTALVNNFDIKREPDLVRKSIGIVFQDPSSDEMLTGYENLNSTDSSTIWILHYERNESRRFSGSLILPTEKTTWSKNIPGGCGEGLRLPGA